MKKIYVLLIASLLLLFSSNLWASPRAVTMWWVIFNNPDACLTFPGEIEQCGELDVFGQAYIDTLEAGMPDPTLIMPNVNAGIAAIHATGGVTDLRGKIRLVASIYLSNEIDIPLDLSSGNVIDPLGLGHAYFNTEAEVHLVIRDHGRARLDGVIEQITNFLEPYCSDPALLFEGSKNTNGKNTCRDVQAAVFAPDEAGSDQVVMMGSGVVVPKSVAYLFRNGDQLTAVVETRISRKPK